MDVVDTCSIFIGTVIGVILTVLQTDDDDNELDVNATTTIKNIVKTC